MPKYMTRSEAATAKDRAAKLMESTGQSDRAEDFRRMSVEQYAEHRGAMLMDNPRSRRAIMSTKTELQDQIEQLEDLLEEALDAELSREEVIGKLKEMKDVIEEPEEEEEEEETEGEEEDEDEDEE